MASTIFRFATQPRSSGGYDLLIFVGKHAEAAVRDYVSRAEHDACPAKRVSPTDVQRKKLAAQSESSGGYVLVRSAAVKGESVPMGRVQAASDYLKAAEARANAHAGAWRNLNCPDPTEPE